MFFNFPADATPVTDCSGLIPTWVHNLRDLNRVEGENILKAQRKYFRGSYSSFNPINLKEIHKAMFGDVWEWAGLYRKTATSIGIKPELIPARLNQLCHIVNQWITYPPHLTFVDMAARIHHQLVYIHPFENGNGRFSRFIADRFLLQWKCKYPIWPDLSFDGLTRKDYIHTLKSADKGDYTSLVSLIRQLGGSDPKLSELIQKSHFSSLLTNGGSSIIISMLEIGANPNEETHNGNRVLQLAIKSGIESIVHALVSCGADVNFVDNSLMSPLQTAISLNHTNIAKFLIENGAINHTNSIII